METENEWKCYLKTKRLSRNIVNKLIRREAFGIKPCTNVYYTRNLLQSIVPNFTIINVEKPPCFLRKFSPDGRYFLAFSADQTSVEIYTFNGSCAGGSLLQGYRGDYVGNKNDNGSEYIRSVAFSTYFKTKSVVNITHSGEQLNRECSLFTDDGRYVIVGSAQYITDDLRPSFYEIFSNNEATTPNPRSPLEDYSLHIVDLQQGKLCDTIQFKVDKIYLSHNQGLYLYKETLAVLSVQHQAIHVFHIIDGTFISIRSIGRFCYDDDHYLLSNVYSQTAHVTFPFRAFRETAINSLKHRLLVYLFKEALCLSNGLKSPDPIRRFYLNFDQIKQLRIWKMQLLDEFHLLIKYASEEVVTFKASEPNSQPSFFVFYNMITTQVLAVFENTSEEMLYLLENFCDYFRNARLQNGSLFLCSPSNNLYARLAQQRFKQTIVIARYGGYTEAIKRMLAQLPISAQSYSSSPYLDLSLFSYDDKWVSAMERPKACGEHPIRLKFYSRESGSLHFKIYAGLIGRSVPPASRRLVAFTFHPSEPFAISVQRTNSDYIVNFHVRLDQ